MTRTSHRIHRDFRLPVLLCRYSPKRWLCWSVLALGMVLGRVALLPLLPRPEPLIQDEFSYLLSADTFAQGRLTNPPLPEPQFFESPHVLLRPIYASKYQPGQGLILALGQKLAGHPYWGVVVSCALMVFLFCWAADAWLPPQWSLIAGGLAAVLFFIPSYWFTSYWGGSREPAGAHWSAAYIYCAAVSNLRDSVSRVAPPSLRPGRTKGNVVRGCAGDFDDSVLQIHG
jgi:hypothetical protein